MSDELSHFATCLVWSTGNWANCNCKNQPPWKVRKEPDELFAWRIWRYTGDGTYEHLMRCSTFSGAISLINGFVELRKAAREG